MCVVPRNVPLFTAMFVGAQIFFCFFTSNMYDHALVFGSLCGHIRSASALFERVLLVDGSAGGASWQCPQGCV